MPNKKQFIDKKNSVTFQVVHRSLKDPLAVDETAPQRVLIPVGKTISKELNKEYYCKQRKEEQEKYGIYFDDDYNYLQHLKDINSLTADVQKLDNDNINGRKSVEKKLPINLPSSVFESNVEEKIGLLNKITPELGIQLESYDPDVIAALDDDFDFNDPNNLLEDNFIELANKENSTSIRNTSNDGISRNENDNRSFQCSYSNNKCNDEIKSCFTSYSMSSSIIKRNEQLTLLDDKFEKMYADYNEEEIGPLDNDHIEGHLNIDSVVISDFIKENEISHHHNIDYINNFMKNHVKIENSQFSILNKDKKENHFEKFTVENKNENFDCESILSTHSNIYNHPKLIIDSPQKDLSIKINLKTGLPQNTLSGSENNRLTSKNLTRLESEYSELQEHKSFTATRSILSTLSCRPKNETPEEKKERKKAFKIYRRERRKERKDNIMAFKEEKKRQEKILINEKQNIQGNRIF